MRWETLVRLLTTFLLECVFALASRQNEFCKFPTRWEGTWFQSGVGTSITIELNRLSNKGRCLASEGDKFLVFDDNTGCFRCVVIHEKHVNALQYKETFCHGRSNLYNLCSLITGDALLYSMFRLNAQPVHCPFKAPLTFTYNRGHGECKNPISNIESCIDDTKLVLRYQACPDVSGTESTVEELECLATWKEGSSRYLVGKVSHSHVTSDEDRFRCFVYEKTSNLAEQHEDLHINKHGFEHTSVSVDTGEYKIAQSGDATCNGLVSPMEGSRTMTLKKAPTLNKCKYPAWLTYFQHWHTLDYRKSYTFHHRNTTLKITNNSAVDISTHNVPKLPSEIPEVIVTPLGLKSSPSDNGELRLVCSDVKLANQEQINVVAHFTMGCQSGYVCMWFYRRDMHVIEVQTGEATRRMEDACLPSHFDKQILPYITLVTTSPETRECPNPGKFQISNLNSEIERTRREAIYVTIIDNDVPVIQRAIYEQNVPSSKRRRRRKRRGNEKINDVNCDDEVATLVVGCETSDTMEFTSECSKPNAVSAYSCHGRWTENDTDYLITTPQSRSSIGAKRYCFIYKEQNGVIHFTSSSHTCVRSINPSVSSLLSFNATLVGQCLEASVSTVISSNNMLMLATLSIVSLLVAR